MRWFAPYLIECGTCLKLVALDQHALAKGSFSDDEGIRTNKDTVSITMPFPPALLRSKEESFADPMYIAARYIVAVVLKSRRVLFVTCHVYDVYLFQQPRRIDSTRFESQRKEEKMVLNTSVFFSKGKKRNNCTTFFSFLLLPFSRYIRVRKSSLCLQFLVNSQEIVVLY